MSNRYKLQDLILHSFSGEWGTDSPEATGVIRTTNFRNNGKINYDQIVRRNIPQSVLNKKKLIDGDIIIEKSGGGPNQPVGRVVYFDETTAPQEPFVCNNFTSVLRPRKNLIFPRYLFYALHYFHKSGKTIKYQNKTTGIVNLRLNSYLEEIIDVPNIVIQKQIVQILDKAQELIDWRKETINILQNTRSSFFQSLFGTESELARKWGKTSLQNLVEKIQTGPFGSLLHAGDYSQDGIPLVNPMHIVEGRIVKDDSNRVNRQKYYELPNYHLKEGDIVMARRGEIGRAAIVTKEQDGWLCGTGSIFIRGFSKITPEYLYWFIGLSSTKKWLSHKAQGATMLNLNQTIIGKIEIPVPALELQLEFKEYYLKSEQIINGFKDNLIDLLRLQNSLSQSAFNGDLKFSSDESDEKEEVDLTDLIDWSVNPKLVENLEKELEDDVDPNTEEGKIILKKRLQLSLKALEKEFTNRVFTASEAFSFIQQDQGGAAIDYEAYRKLIWRLLDEGRLHQTWHPADSPAAQMLLEFTDGDQI